MESGTLARAAWLVAGCIALLAGCTPASSGLDRHPAPGFQVVGLDNVTRTLEEYKGRPLLISFWGPHCPPCRKEMPHIAALASSKETQVIAITVGGNNAASRAFLRKMGVGTADLDTGTDKRGDVLARYGGVGLPLTVAINPEGLIAARAPRAVDAAELAAMVKEAR